MNEPTPLRELVGTIVYAWLTELDLAAPFYDPQSDPVVEGEGGGQIVQRLTRRLGLAPSDGSALRHAIASRIQMTLQAQALTLSAEANAALLQQVYDEIVGLSILQPLLDDQTIAEIMVNGPQAIYVEQRGTLHKLNLSFDDSAHLMRIIQRLLLPLGTKIDSDHPIVMAHSDHGTLIQAVIPPIALDEPSLTLRKFRRNRLTVEDLIRFGSLTPAMAALLQACIGARLNILVAGGTGSGKTTLLNVLSAAIPDNERVVTIEDVAMLHLAKEHVVRLVTRPPDRQGRGAISKHDLLRAAAQMRPERVIIGDVQGSEVVDLLRLISEGHDGSMVLMHANTPSDALARLETMILCSNPGLPEAHVQRLITTGIDLIIQQTRLEDGQRKVASITALEGVEQGAYVLNDLVALEVTGKDAQGRLTTRWNQSSQQPSFLPRLAAYGFTLPL